MATAEIFYPDGLSGDRIPLAALSQDVALAEVHRCHGTQFDPAVVEALDRVGGGLSVAAQSA